MDVKKIKENLVKISIFVLNLILVAGGIFYFKNKDQQKKEEKKQIDSAYNQEISKYEIEQIQQALIESKIQNEQSIADNPENITTQQKTIVEKTIPAVTKQVTVPKTTTGSSKTTKSS